MEVGVGIITVEIGGLLRLAKALRGRVVHDQPKLLLADVARTPHLAFLRQEAAANQRGKLLVVRGHLLQRRIGIREPQRAGAAFIRAMGMNLRVDAPIHRVAEDVALKKLHRRVVVPVRFDDQRRKPMRVFVHPAGRAGGE